MTNRDHEDELVRAFNAAVAGDGAAACQWLLANPLNRAQERFVRVAMAEIERLRAKVAAKAAGVPQDRRSASDPGHGATTEPIAGLRTLRLSIWSGSGFVPSSDQSPPMPTWAWFCIGSGW
jgi:hypothetical protein